MMALNIRGCATYYGEAKPCPEINVTAAKTHSIENHTAAAHDSKASSELPAPRDIFEKARFWIFEPLIEAFQKVARLPPSPGYETYLIARRSDALPARAIARIIVRHGERVAANSARLPIVAKAIRYVAKSDHFNKPLRRNIQTILSAWHESSVLETIFEGRDNEVFEFIRLLEMTETGNAVALNRVRLVATEILPWIKIPRGPKISAASISHDFFLTNTVPVFGQNAGYTYNSVTASFSDDASQATLREFGRAHFDPRPSNRRRIRRGLRV